MRDGRQKYAALKNLVILSQFGLSLVLPMMLLLYGSLWLRERFGLGSWITLIALLLSILSWISTVSSFMRYALGEAKKGEQKK